MSKSKGAPGVRTIYFILILVQILVTIVGTALIIWKLDGAGDAIKNMIVAVALLTIVLTLGLMVAMLKLMQDEDSVLTKKNDKYKKLFLNLPIGFAQAQILRDDQTGRDWGYEITDANETFERLFDVVSSDYQGKILSDSRNEVLKEINGWFDAYENSGTKQGELLSVEITVEKLNRVFNTVMYKFEADSINMVVMDITAQKERETKLSVAVDDANAAYKTQSEFLANMSHEIRTPINGIMGMLQVTMASDDLAQGHWENLMTAKNCAKTLLRLINDILDISKLEAGKYSLHNENFNIREMIEKTVAAQLPAAQEKNLTLEWECSGETPPLVRGDAQRIQQVLNCLLSNAIKFTNEGGVRVKAACMEEALEQVRLRIAVADSGIGISEEDRSKLFVRFSQVDSPNTRKYGGSGLGLVITKQIVELMGGDITVQSKEGVGSTFIVEIPLRLVPVSGYVRDQKEDAFPFPMAGKSRARILVAEDEPVNQQVIGKLLGMAGYSYDIAENGKKAVELYQKKEYQAALFDVQMPVLDGIQATKEIRAMERGNHVKRLPIIAVTARAMFGDKERILEAELDDYIAKPYNFNDVVEILNRYVDKEVG